MGIPQTHNIANPPPPSTMSSKRLKLTHYKIAGRDRPVVQVVDHRHSKTPPTKASRGKKQSKRRPVTFRVEGSLRCDSNDSPLPSNDESQQNMPNIPSDSSPFLEELEHMFDGPVVPEESPADDIPGVSKKVSPVYMRFRAELTVQLYTCRHQTTGYQRGLLGRLLTILTPCTIAILPLPTTCATSVGRWLGRFTDARPV
jgi:hypothetical protein